MMATAVSSPLPLETFPVDLYLTEEFLKSSENGPKETPENRSEKLQELLRLINEKRRYADKHQIANLHIIIALTRLDTPDLVTRTDEKYLLRFLRAKYFHVNYAFQLLKNYEDFKIKYPDWLKVHQPTLKQLICSGAVQVLPSRDQHGRRIFYLQGGLWKPSLCSAEYALQAGGLCGDATIVEPMTQVAGIVMIFDLKDVGMAQLKGLSTAFAKKMVYFLANCLPVRINAIHIIHEPSVFSLIFAVFKAFLTDRMKKRIHFHGSSNESLHKHITPSALPQELGGTFTDLDPLEWYKVLTGDLVVNEFKSLGYKLIED